MGGEICFFFFFLIYCDVVSLMYHNNVYRGMLGIEAVKKLDKLSSQCAACIHINTLFDG